MEYAIQVRDLEFSYKVDGKEVPILKGVSFDIKKGDFVAINGPSGSGKSTLFHILGCLLKPTKGRVIIGGQDISQLTNRQMAVLRNQKIGFVFQQFHLLPRADVIENMLLPTRFSSDDAAKMDFYREKAENFARRLGLEKYAHHKPNQLSGGQQQRIAISRALMHDVDIVLADEPTGNLDSKNSNEIMAILRELHTQGKTIVLITHDTSISDQCANVLYVRDGALVFDEELGPVAEPQAKMKDSEAGSLQTWAHSVNAAVSGAIVNLKRNRTRSILTMLGITIGIASVLAMLTVGQFTKRKLLKSYEDAGINKVELWARPHDIVTGDDVLEAQFTQLNWNTDVLPLKRIYSAITGISPLMKTQLIDASYAGRVLGFPVTLFGVSPDYLGMTNRELSEGHNFSSFQMGSASPICIIGSDVAHGLFKELDPLGRFIEAATSKGHFRCRVAGVMKPQQNVEDIADRNKLVIVPYTYYKRATEYSASILTSVMFEAAPGTDIERFGRAIGAFFQNKYGHSGIFSINSNVQLIAQMKRTINLFTLLITFVALLVLTVGAIGINNMMLVSVNERFKEIGLLKALGAPDRSIRIQFLTESVVICSLAGLIGLILGVLTYEAIIFGASKFMSKMSFEWAFEPFAFTLSILVVLAVGVISGILPALKAEKLEVIEALRSE